MYIYIYTHVYTHNYDIYAYIYIYIYTYMSLSHAMDLGGVATMRCCAHARVLQHITNSYIASAKMTPVFCARLCYAIFEPRRCVASCYSKNTPSPPTKSFPIKSP